MPVSECVACLYITHLSDSFTYNSVVNYVSALWALHKTMGYPYPDPSGFLISSTLRGAKFELGCATNQAAPMTVDLMRRIYLLLNMSAVDDVVFWLMLIAGFRGLLRKSNLCEPGFRICVKDVEFCAWGIKVTIRKSKTITFGERNFVVPFARLYCSCFCFEHYLRQLFSMVRYPSLEHPLFARFDRAHRLIPANYNWFSNRLRNVCHALDIPVLTSHSLRREGLKL